MCWRSSASSAGALPGGTQKSKRTVAMTMTTTCLLTTTPMTTQVGTCSVHLFCVQHPAMDVLLCCCQSSLSISSVRLHLHCIAVGCTASILMPAADLCFVQKLAHTRC